MNRRAQVKAQQLAAGSFIICQSKEFPDQLRVVSVVGGKDESLQDWKKTFRDRFYFSTINSILLIYERSGSILKGFASKEKTNIY
jgi:hypothetical protein